MKKLQPYLLRGDKLQGHKIFHLIFKNDNIFILKIINVLSLFKRLFDNRQNFTVFSGKEITQ